MTPKTGTRQAFSALAFDEFADEMWPMVFNLKDDSHGGEGLAGHTSFGRHETLCTDLGRYLSRREEAGPLSMLFLGPSVGCQPYRFLMEAAQRKLFRHDKLGAIDALDASEKFTALARAGVYPLEALRQLDTDVLYYTERGTEAGTFSISPDIRDKINFLPAQTLQTWEPSERPYGITVATNVLNYVRDIQEAHDVCAKIFRATDIAVCFNGAGEALKTAVKAAMEHEGFVCGNAYFRPRSEDFNYDTEDHLIAVRSRPWFAP